MPTLADRTKDTTTTTGTGAITLAGSPPTGFQSFATGLGSAACVTAYTIDDGAGAWEEGLGTFNGTTGLTRDKVFSSSNTNALVNFGAGTKTVFVTAPADLIDDGNYGHSYAMARGWAMP